MPVSGLDAIADAARRLCTVIIQYSDAKGVTTTREVEPYSLRPGKAGSTRFFAFDIAKQQIRGFRLDRISQATSTENPYTPQWVVEF